MKQTNKQNKRFVTCGEKNFFANGAEVGILYFETQMMGPETVDSMSVVEIQRSGYLILDGTKLVFSVLQDGLTVFVFHVSFCSFCWDWRAHSVTI